MIKDEIIESTNSIKTTKFSVEGYEVAFNIRYQSKV
jgi:hypothetical protein